MSERIGVTRMRIGPNIESVSLGCLSLRNTAMRLATVSARGLRRSCGRVSQASSWAMSFGSPSSYQERSEPTVSSSSRGRRPRPARPACRVCRPHPARWRRPKPGASLRGCRPGRSCRRRPKPRCRRRRASGRSCPVPAQTGCLPVSRSISVRRLRPLTGH